MARFVSVGGMCIFLWNCRIGQSGQEASGQNQNFGQELSFPCRTVVWPDLFKKGVCAFSCRIVELAKVAKWPVAKIKNFGQELSFPCRTVVWPDLFKKGAWAFSCRIVELAKMVKWPVAKIKNFGQELSFLCRTVV